jgi:hypothetical protein
MRFESHRLNRKTYELTIKVKAEETNIPASNLQRVFTELSGLYTHMAEQSFNAPKPRLSKKQQEILDSIKEATRRNGRAYLTGETYNMRIVRNLFDKNLIKFHPEDEQHKYNWKRPSREIENDGVYFVVPTAESFNAENKGNILVYQGYRDTIDTFIGRFNTLEEAENHIYNTWMEDAHDTIQEFRSRRDGTFVSPFLADLLKDRKRKGQDWSEADKEMIKSIKLRDATFTDENKETLKYYEDNIDKWVNEWKILSQTPKGSIQQSGAWLYTANTEPPMYQGYSQRYQDGNGNYPYIILDPAFNPDSHGAESFNADELEFTDWANQETKHHGKTSLKGWADHEIKKHGANMPFDEWAKHEDKSHIKRYGAENDWRGWMGD